MTIPRNDSARLTPSPPPDTSAVSASPHDPADTNEDIVGEIAERHGSAHEPLFAVLTPSTAVGQILLLDYDTATLAVHDYHRERAGGLARGMFLLAGDEHVGDEAEFVLLRVTGATRLSNQVTTDEAKLTAAREAIGRELWSDNLTRWIQDEVALGGVEARILGTFASSGEGELRFAEDIANYYSARGAFAWKPEGELLERIVNLTHRGNSLDLSELALPPGSDLRVSIARTRFSAADGADPDSPVQVPVRIDPTDLVKRRTAFLGMSRSGKSNAMKITARAVYMLREKHPQLRVGQLIFDPNGEYAQDNPQDGRGLHRVHELLRKERESEVATYGMYKPPTDPERRVTKINFFGNSVAIRDRTNRNKVSAALAQLFVGRELIQEKLVAEPSIYTKSFRDADFHIPIDLENHGVATRYHRAVLVHRTALAAAGFGVPAPSSNLRGLFSRQICDALCSEENEASENHDLYRRAGDTLRGDQASWASLADAFTSLILFIEDSNSIYKAFEQQYRASSGSGEDWADARLKSVLSIFRWPYGVRKFQELSDQHSADTTSDYAEDIVQDLRAGKLVIFDQSIGSPELNEKAAERIMWKVFTAQQQMFTSTPDAKPWERHVLVYVEEAHNLLPGGGGKDVLSTVWARTAKEGGKMNLGMILATQAPSSVLPEILSETDNWFISHLNSDSEARVVKGYQDFADFVPQIRRVSEPGFIRLRTLSAGYTVPVKLDRFRLPDPPESDGDSVGERSA